MKLIFEQIRVGGDRNFGYLLADRHAGEGVLIDPSYSPETMVQRAADQSITIVYIVNTHGHPDHINGNEKAVELTGARVAAHPACPVKPSVTLTPAEKLAFGTLQLTVIDTPGHSDDHVVLYEPVHRILVTGDLLFVGKVGGTRTEAEHRTEWDSLQRVLAGVAGDATVWPGHDYGVRPSSTIDLEKHTNPFLQCPDIDAFITLKRDWPEYKKRLGLK
jgi:glyoxylase-like metal-dependent hydrolase (beta-lactamase superfamily II)